MLVQSAHRGPVPLSVQSSFCIPGRTEIIVSCNNPKSSREQLRMVVPLPETAKASIPPHIFPAYTVSQADDRTVFVCLMNTPTNDFQLQAGQKIGEFCPVVETLEHPPLNSSQRSYVASSFGVKDNTNIDPFHVTSLNERRPSWRHWREAKNSDCT